MLDSHEPFKKTQIRPLLRSLLQKAVRRGRADVAEKAAIQLGNYDDSMWLKSRLGVLVFEECWQHADILHQNAPITAKLREISHSSKNKNASGLGSMAHAFLEGDLSTLEYTQDLSPLKIVTAALKRPESFFAWAQKQCSDEDQLSTVLAAKQYFSRASWPWDKAFMIAGAYLHLNCDVPPELCIQAYTEDPFPYWVAVDKHTPQGKAALRQVAASIGMPEIQLQWTSFYLESAKTQNLTYSPWWESETKWRLSEIGLTETTAADLWNFASPLVQAAALESAELLRTVIERPSRYALC